MEGVGQPRDAKTKHAKAEIRLLKVLSTFQTLYKEAIDSQSKLFLRNDNEKLKVNNCYVH
jgi:hypothetical protein